MERSLPLSLSMASELWTPDATCHTGQPFYRFMLSKYVPKALIDTPHTEAKMTGIRKMQSHSVINPILNWIFQCDGEHDVSPFDIHGQLVESHDVD